MQIYKVSPQRSNTEVETLFFKCLLLFTERVYKATVEKLIKGYQSLSWPVSLMKPRRLELDRIIAKVYEKPRGFIRFYKELVREKSQ